MPLSTSAGNMDASIAAIAANHTYGATAIPPGYVLVTTAPSPTSDLIHPEVWKNSATGDVIIAFRGTDPFDLKGSRSRLGNPCGASSLGCTGRGTLLRDFASAADYYRQY